MKKKDESLGSSFQSRLEFLQKARSVDKYDETVKQMIIENSTMPKFYFTMKQNAFERELEDMHSYFGHKLMAARGQSKLDPLAELMKMQMDINFREMQYFQFLNGVSSGLVLQVKYDIRTTIEVIQYYQSIIDGKTPLEKAFVLTNCPFCASYIYVDGSYDRQLCRRCPNQTVNNHLILDNSNGDYPCNVNMQILGINAATPEMQAVYFRHGLWLDAIMMTENEFILKYTNIIYHNIDHEEIKHEIIKHPLSCNELERLALIEAGDSCIDDIVETCKPVSKRWIVGMKYFRKLGYSVKYPKTTSELSIANKPLKLAYLNSNSFVFEKMDGELVILIRSIWDDGKWFLYTGDSKK